MTAMDMVSPGGSSVDARIQGDISGQVAVGNNILQKSISLLAGSHRSPEETRKEHP